MFVSDPLCPNSTLASAIRLHRNAAVVPAARFMSTHVTNAACEDHEPGFLGSVETFFDRVSGSAVNDIL
jgi:glutamate dehydrogenase (NAD(P)+)